MKVAEREEMLFKLAGLVESLVSSVSVLEFFFLENMNTRYGKNAQKVIRASEQGINSLNDHIRAIGEDMISFIKMSMKVEKPEDLSEIGENMPEVTESFED